MNRVLIVDDEYVIRESLSDFFSFILSMEVLVAENGQEALRILQDNEIDLVITDIDMPVMNGLDLAKAIHSSSPDQNIIMMSGRDHSKEVSDLLQRNVIIGFIAKPFNLIDLKNQLNYLAS